MYIPDSFPQYPNYRAYQTPKQPAPNVEARDKSQIDCELDELQVSIAGLGASLEILESRLTPVLNPETQAKEQLFGTNPKPENALGANLHTQKQMVQGMSAFLQAILDRLAI